MFKLVYICKLGYTCKLLYSFNVIKILALGHFGERI